MGRSRLTGIGTVHWVRSVCLVCLACLVVGTAPAQERDPERRLEREIAYLLRSPHNRSGFEIMVAGAADHGGLVPLIERWEREAAETGRGPAARVVLARLLAHSGDTERALALLTETGAGFGTDPGPEHLALVAELQVATGSMDDALETIERALDRATDGDLRAELHERAAEAHLFSGRREEAIACFERLAQEAPASGMARLEVARASARHGLTEAALVHYREARELFAGDSERTSRTLAEQGALHELRLEGDEAVRCYLEADELLARGHWLTSDLRARLISLHRRSGTLSSLIEHYRGAVQARPRELDPREALAGALVAAGELDEAAEVLSSAVADYPQDLELARRRIDLARLAEDDTALVAELQRAVDLGRGDRELRFELAQAFLRQGRESQARLQWARLREAAPADAELCARIGRAWAAAGHEEEARSALEQAARLDPTSISRHLELAQHHLGQGRADEALEVLQAADATAVSTVGDLELLADFHEGRLDRERAADALERAVTLEDPARIDGRRLMRLGRLSRKIGRTARAAEVFRTLIDLERDTTLRGDAVKEYVSLVPRGEARVRVLREEEAAIAEGADFPAPYLIVSELRQRAGDRTGAQGVLAEWLLRRPDDLDARLDLARSLEVDDQLDLALEQVLELLERFPRRRRATLLRCVRLYEELGRVEDALSALGEVARGAADNPAALRDAAAGYRRLGRREEAVEQLERALRIDADHLASRRELAALRWELGDLSGARADLERAYAVATFELRPELAQELHEILGNAQNLRAACDTLEARAAANPYDTTSATLAAELHLLEGNPRKALTALAPREAANSLDPYLLTLRARVHHRARDFQSAVADLEVLLRLEGADHAAVLKTLVGVLLDADRRARALEVARQMDDPREAAKLLARRGLKLEGAELLTEALDLQTVGVEGWRELGLLLDQAGFVTRAAAALETYLQAVPNDLTVLRRLGDLRFELEDIAGVLEVGHRLVMEDSGGQGLESWFKTKGLLQDYMRMRGELVVDYARDAEDVNAGLEALLRRKEGARVGIEVLEHLSGREEPPAGFTTDSWAMALRDWRMAFFGRDRRFGRARLKELRELLDDDGLHPAWEWVEYADLLGLGIKIWRSDWKLMERGLEQHGGDPRFLTLVAGYAYDKQLHQLDLRVLELLDAALSEPTTAALVAEAHRVTWTQHRNEVRRRLPLGSLTGLQDERLDQLARLTYHHAALAEGLGVVPFDRDDVGLRIGASLIALGREEQGRARLAALEPDDPLELAAWIRLARAWAEIGRTQEVERIHGRIMQARDVLASDNRFAGYKRWEDSLSSFWPEMGRHLETAGRLVEAYDLLREVGSFESALSLLFRRDLTDPVIERYQSQLQASIEALPPDLAVADLEALERLHDLGLKLTEVQLLAGRFDEAVDTFSVLLECLPANRAFFEPALLAARSAERDDETLGILRRRLRASGPNGAAQPKGWDPSALLEPMPIAEQLLARPRGAVSTGLPSVTLVSPGGGTGGRFGGRRNIRSHASTIEQDVHDRLQILTLELKQGLAEEARAQVSLGHLRSMAAGFHPIQIQELGQLVLSNATLGSCLELLEILRELDSTSVPLLGQHTRLLIGLGRFDDAEAEMAAFTEPVRARATLARRRKQIEAQKRWRAAVDGLEDDDD